VDGREEVQNVEIVFHDQPLSRWQTNRENKTLDGERENTEDG
jgi:hypothetical protein